ncbi:Peptidase T [Roseimaritima multifibrata]|uniref:Peptidase T n=1 Tax=Roseimaritima multifibrata TaxID=1930274 RepID=A0A517MKN4_9BACT|nr:peptidase T [Roseimaritima multifibrata]QDS95443.1 Peptidase T [Roseimaritima multifibrata]
MSNQINRDRLLERFLAYVGVDTAANPDTTRYPSSAGQWELGNLLTQQLEDLGADYPHQDEHGLVWASVPATDGGNSPTIALIAHLDTSPEAPSANISPQVIKNYEGGDILLPSGQVIRVDQTPELNDLIGSTLITTDGTTLLGGDDKAGVAIIMELAQHLIENPHLEHGTVRILFTCDEEIGRGTDKINLSKLDAAAAYTLDGGGAGDLDVETFSADAATVTFRGHNIHPAIAKGRMVNAVRAAAYFVDLLPRDQQTPETTSGREGFIHAHNIHGGVGNATVELILRSFDTAELDLFADQIRTLAETVQEHFPGLQVDVQVRSQYRNLAEGLQQSPEVVQFAEQAYQNLQRTYRKTIIRGGTDGSQLTEKGLPTPNLSSGQHNIHAVHEFACLDQMEDAIEHLVELLRLWSQQAKS